ncbi:MAG: Uma2 family endonuclease [bacterium]|nr:Uma2 family endonuclease [bacterium]
MGLAVRKETQKFTYGDYLKWDDGERWELIDGEAYNMTPAPRRIHQEISGELFVQLRNQLSGKSCKAYFAPFDVRLPMENENEDDITNVVQPDITVICDQKKLDDKGCLGTPDFVIEILSPGNPRHDRMVKFNLYEKAGVKEYWIVSPEGQMVEVFLLGPQGSYGRPQFYSQKDIININVLKDITIDLGKVFEEVADSVASPMP